MMMLKQIFLIATGALAVPVLLVAACFVLTCTVHDPVYSQPKPAAVSVASENNLASFLASPLDLKAFKKKKNSSNSGTVRKNEMFYTPEKAGFFYRYMLFPTPTQYNEYQRFADFAVIVYKFGEKIGDYSDTNETLIAVWCRLKDPDLGEADLVETPVSEIKKRFGEPFATVGDVLVYQNQERALSVHTKDEKVDWFKYIRLNRAIEDPKAVPKIMLQPQW
jgi:hypothetical protein